MRSLRVGVWAALVVGVVAVCSADEGLPSADTPEAELAKFREIKSPVAYTERSVSRGKMIYRRMCTECHGLDGKAQIDVVANATNLTNPEKYFHGTSEGEIFHSIRDGAGIDMPPFKVQIHDEKDLWNLVNFVRSLWPEDKRPKFQDEESSDTTADGDKASPGGTDHESDEGH